MGQTGDHKKALKVSRLLERPSLILWHTMLLQDVTGTQLFIKLQPAQFKAVWGGGVVGRGVGTGGENAFGESVVLHSTPRLCWCASNLEDGLLTITGPV